MSTAAFPVGSFVEELLVTDTRVYEVVAVTPKTIKVRLAKDTDFRVSENRDGNPWPCVWTGVTADPDAETRVLRLRKDGTFRTFRNGRPFRRATEVDGKVVRYTDYRF